MAGAAAARMPQVAADDDDDDALQLQQAAAEGEEEEGDDGSDGASECFPPRFASWAALDACVRELRGASFQLFYVRRSSPVGARNAALRRRRRLRAQELIPPAFRFHRRLYCCTHGARPRDSAQSGPVAAPLRARAAVRATGCPARLQAQVQYDAEARCHFVGVTAAGRHNHPCGRTQFFAYPESRRVTEPAILRRMRALVARGLNASAIRDKIAALVAESRGVECVPTRKDVYNLIMKFRKEAARAAGDATPAAAAANGGDDGDAADDSAEDETMFEPEEEDEADSGAESDAEADNTALAPTRAGRKTRRAATTRGADSSESEDDALLARLRQRKRRGVKLSRLHALLDAPYSFSQARDEIRQVVTARAEHVPQTIASFQHVIERVARADERVQDVDFVLPRYVLHGCAVGILQHCEQHGLVPPQVVVTLPVVRESGSGSEPETALEVTIASHQLRTMRAFYVARDTMEAAARAIKWLGGLAALRSCPPAPFDDVFHQHKDALAHLVRFMPLTRVVVRGRHFPPYSKLVEFTDSLHGASVLKFASSEAIDLDCVKAVTLSLHARFHAAVGFMCPAFNFESSLEERYERAQTYGALAAARDLIAGAVQLESRRWGSFVLTLSERRCVVFVPAEGESVELLVLLDALFRFFVESVTFECAPRPSDVGDDDTGVLALLFVELTLLRKTWADLPQLLSDSATTRAESLAYFRARFLAQAVQVVSKQDVHDIRWL